MPIIESLTGSSSARDPFYHAVVVTPSDSADLPFVTTGFWVGAAGDLTVVMGGGQLVTFNNLYVGYHPIRARRVLATGTTASDIIAGSAKW